MIAIDLNLPDDIETKVDSSVRRWIPSGADRDVQVPQSEADDRHHGTGDHVIGLTAWLRSADRQAGADGERAPPHQRVTGAGSPSERRQRPRVRIRSR